MYAVTATRRIKTDDGYTRIQQVPTFYLNPDVQGIVDEKHAGDIALDILGPNVTIDVQKV
jgi:hypothetical protein